MLGLVLILLGIVLAFLLFFWAASTYTSRVFAKIATKHVGHTDWLIHNGIAPLDWTEAQRQRIEALEASGAENERLLRLKSRYRQRLLARLERHLRYVERATVVASESERHQLGDELRAVGRCWEAATWDQIVGLEEMPLGV